MRQVLIFALLLCIAGALIGCGGSGSKFSPQPMPNIGGAWEMIAAPAVNNGAPTGIEIALKEGKVFNPATGVFEFNGQLSASGTQISFVGITPGGIIFGGNCPVAGPDLNGNNMAGTISGGGGSFNFTYTENGNDFDVTATISADGKSMMGTYASQARSNCGESGVITGQAVSKLGGTYLGKLILPDGSNQSVTASLSENSSATLNVNLLANGTAFTLSGPVAGNFLTVQGTFQGQSVSYEGYYQLAFDSSDQAFDIQTLYLVNAATPDQLAGQLTVPLVQ